MVDFNELAKKNKAYEDTYYIVVSGDKEFVRDYLMFLPSNGSIKPFTSMDVINQTLDTVLSKVKERGLTIRIITGDNRGADASVINYAIAHDYDVDRYEADWDEYGNRAGFIRNENMFLVVSTKPHKAAMLYWDGHNHYTRNLIYNAYLQSTSIKVYNYALKRWMSQDEIRQVQLLEDEKQFQYRK